MSMPPSRTPAAAAGAGTPDRRAGCTGSRWNRYWACGSKATSCASRPACRRPGRDSGCATATATRFIGSRWCATKTAAPSTSSPWSTMARNTPWQFVTGQHKGGCNEAERRTGDKGPPRSDSAGQVERRRRHSRDAAEKVGAVMVPDAEGCPVGIFTERDVVRLYADGEREFETLALEARMTCSVKIGR